MALTGVLMWCGYGRDFGDKDDLVDSLLRIARKEKAGLPRQRSDDGGIEMSHMSATGPRGGARGRGGEENGVEVEMTRFRHGEEGEEGEDDDIVMADLDGEEGEEEGEGLSSGLLNKADQKNILEIMAK